MALGWQPPPKASAMPQRDALLALGWAPPETPTNLPGLATSPLSNACSAEPTSGGGSSPQAGQLGDTGKDATTEAIDDITKRIQGHITRKAEKHGRDDDSEGTDDERPAKTQRKGRGGRGKGGQGRGRAAPQAKPKKKGKVTIKSESPKKRKRGTPGCNTPPGPKPKPQVVKACLAKVRVALPFKGVQKGPLHYKSITVYTNKSLKAWRVKPGPGRRDEKVVSYANDKRQAWSIVQEKAAEYLAVSQ